MYPFADLCEQLTNFTTMAHPYPIVEVLPGHVLADEPMGTKDKFWVQVEGDDERWLFKYARVNNGVPTGEHWAEKIAAEVAEYMGLPHAEVELARFNDQPGCISRRFTELSFTGTALAHGNAVLEGQVIGYDRNKVFRQSDHTLTNILRVVDKMFVDPEDKRIALDHLMGYLVLDGLILNTDRHHENWALIRYTSSTGKEQGHRMAPTFDHASALARNATPSQLEAWGTAPVAVARYARNAPGAIYASASDKKGMNPIELVKLALRVKPTPVLPWLKRLHNLDPEVLAEIVYRVPPEMMSPAQQQFTTALLRHTLSTLQQLTP